MDTDASRRSRDDRRPQGSNDDIQLATDTSQVGPHARDTVDAEMQRIVDRQLARAQQLKRETVGGGVVRDRLATTAAA